LKLAMMGTGPFAAPTFESLLDGPHEVVAAFCQPERPLVGKKAPPESPIALLARQRDVPLYRPASINSPEAHEILKRLAADLFVVCDYGQILSSETLSLAKKGGINLHGSLLPRHRGSAPVQWAIRRGDEVTGVTVIHMTPKLDGGPMLVVERRPIAPRETADRLEQRLSFLGPAAVDRALAMLETWDGESQIGEMQDPTLATRAPRLKREDGLIEWTGAAAEIERQFRAFQPWPGVFSWARLSDGRILRAILNDVRLDDGANASSEPGEGADARKAGEVVDADRERIRVQTGQGTVSIRAIQPAGKRSLTPAEFLNGYPLKPGDRFLSADPDAPSAKSGEGGESRK
jgi:methionyl-tRNA formyltransferase